MAKPGTKAVALARKPTNVTPIVVCNVPKGRNWGWYSREDPRVHLQIVDEPPHHKVWLEARGKRVFEPVDREMAALRLWSHRPEEQVPYDARLSTLLWTGPLDV